MLKISKLDIHLPLDLVKTCAALNESQLCKFVATNTEGEFQHSIEVKSKQENVVSLELSNLEIGYEDGRFVAQIMKVFKVYQGDAGGGTEPPPPAAISPHQRHMLPDRQTFLNRNDGATLRKGAQDSASLYISEPRNVSQEKTNDPALQAIPHIGDHVSLPDLTSPSSVEYRNTHTKLTTFHAGRRPEKDDVAPQKTISPRQLYRNVAGKRSEPSAASGAPSAASGSPHVMDPSASKRPKLVPESDCSNTQESNSHTDNMNTNPFDAKDVIIEIKKEEDVVELSDKDDGESHQSLGDQSLSQDIPPGPFIAPGVVSSFNTDNDQAQSTPFIQDFFSIANEEHEGAGPSQASDSLSFPSDPNNSLIPNWQSPDHSAGEGSSSQTQSPAKPRNLPRARVMGSLYRKATPIKMGVDLQQQKRFPCTICHKSFTLLTNLRRHMNVHTHRRFVCLTCGKAFKRSDYLLEHTRHVHQKAAGMPLTGKKLVVPTSAVMPIETKLRPASADSETTQ